jgi:hypothetical protein
LDAAGVPDGFRSFERACGKGAIVAAVRTFGQPDCDEAPMAATNRGLRATTRGPQNAGKSTGQNRGLTLVL